MMTPQAPHLLALKAAIDNTFSQSSTSCCIKALGAGAFKVASKVQELVS
jgi:hypothetical protein